MSITRIGSAALLAVALSFGVIACEDKKGPAERMGEKVDNAAGEIKAEAKEAKKEIKDAADDAEDKLDH